MKKLLNAENFLFPQIYAAKNAGLRLIQSIYVILFK